MMRKRIVALLVCVGVLAFALVGCGENSTSGVPREFVGTWNLVEMVEADETVGADDLALLKSLHYEAYLELREDGTAKFDSFGDVSEGTWESAEQGTGTLVFDKQAVDMTIKDGKLELVQEGAFLVFEKGEQRSGSSSASSQAASSSSKASSKASSSGSSSAASG